MPKEQPIEQNELLIIKNASIKPNNQFTIYTNHSLLGMTPWDVQMIFSRLEAGEVEGSVSHVATVIMSPQHAKAFLQALSGSLKAYEQEFGEIQVPNVKSFEQSKE